MNLFLTGDIQIGKTTALRKALTDFHGVAAGFLTYAGPVKADGARDVYLKAFGAPDIYDSGHRVCERSSPAGRKIFPEIFETAGAMALREALSQKPNLVVMDELGIFEENCEAFKEAVFACLSSAIPVLGVLKKADSGFLNGIRRRPDVEVIEVTAENRDHIVPELSARLRLLQKE